MRGGPASFGASLERAGTEDLVGPHVALGHEPAAAAEVVVPALALRAREVAPGAPRRQQLAAVAELGRVAGAAVGAVQEEGHRHTVRASGRGPAVNGGPTRCAKTPVNGGNNSL